MVEIQCSSCHTRYRIDERVLPEETPTFKCSRCGHVFSIEPRGTKPASAKAGAAEPAASKATEPKASDAKAIEPETAESGNTESQSAQSETVEPKTEAAPKARAVNGGQPAHAAKAPQSRVRRSLKVVPPPPPSSEPVAQSATATTPEPKLAVEAAKAPLANPLARPFSEAGAEPEAGDTMSFDFSIDIEEQIAALETTREEEPTPEDEEWEVGDSASEFPVEHAGPRAREFREGEKKGFRMPLPPQNEGRDFPGSDAAMPSLGHAVHSAGFLLALFFFVVLGFGALSLLMTGEPMASVALLAKLPVVGDHFVNPASPAVQVALREVSAEYQSVNGGRSALVITGQALNVGGQPLHDVQIAVSLLNGGQQAVAKQSVFCGNSLSGRMINQMTPREIEFFQRLGPPKTFVLPLSGSSTFTIVFVDPPAGAGRFAIQVASVSRAAASGATDSAPASPGT